MMEQAISSRELMSLEGGGFLLRGTYHKPRINSSSAHVMPASSTKPSQIGVLFVNSFSTPRASYGDTAVSWADAVAAIGFPCFRFDLPGLGDAEGNTPADLLDFINDGGYAAATVTLVRQLAQRFKLDGMVLLGHCAGATTALYAAAELKECTGVILMDPYFHLTKGLKPKLRLKLGDWAARSKVGSALSNTYALTRRMRQHLRKNALPGNANTALLSRWKQVASQGKPILLIKGSTAENRGVLVRPGQFDYLNYVLGLAGRKAHLQMKLVDDTDHCFANDEGRKAIRQHLETWLHETFAASSRQEALSPTAQAQSQSENHTYRADCLHA